MRRLALALALALLWRPLLRPLAKGGLILLEVYSNALLGRNLAALLAPAPRERESLETYGGTPLRVSWWRPARGERHPAILLIPGASPLGNDFPELRMVSRAIARAGYLVALAEFPSLKEDRFEPRAVEEIDGAFAALLAQPAARRPVGAFGFSVGGGMLLAAAGRGAALRRADWLGVLGAYFDIDTFLATAVSGMQRRDGRLIPWQDSEDARRRMPRAATWALADAAERRALLDALDAGPLAATPPASLGDEAGALWRVLAAPDHDEALRRVAELPPSLRAAMETLSARPVWAQIQAPVFWIHDANDGYVPVAELEAALVERSRRAPLRATVPRLLQHAAPFGETARQRGVLFWAAELANLLRFAVELLRVAG